MNKGVWVGGLVAVIVIIGLVVWASRSDAPAVTDEPMTGEGVPEEEQMMVESPLVGTPAAVLPTASPAATGQVKIFPVSASEFKFSTTEIRVKQGDMVRITLTNTGAMPHDWRLDEFNAATSIIQGGQTDTVEFVAGEAGTFEYYCSVGTHRQQGMVGKLIVE